VTDLFLGIIALGVMMLAVAQVAAIVVATRTARRVGDAVSRLEHDVRPIVADIRPIVAHLHTISAEAARVSTMAAAQVERAEQMLADLSRRVDATAARVQSTIIDPAREGFAVLQGIIAAFSVFRDGHRHAARPKGSAPVEDEDPLFIG
jgi:hypothetical protein